MELQIAFHTYQYNEKVGKPWLYNTGLSSCYVCITMDTSYKKGIVEAAPLEVKRFVVFINYRT